jgi:hypothetical protein
VSTQTTEEKLDEALRQTFPASDAFSMTPAKSPDELRREYKPRGLPRQGSDPDSGGF